MFASYRVFDITLKAKKSVSPSLLRCVFTGPEVHRMKLEAPDQRIKLFFPVVTRQSQPLEHSNDWYCHYMTIPKAQRPIMRTYTLRALRNAENEMDVEFALHGVNGPASAWVIHAVAGDRLQVVAPNADFSADSGGYEWAPPAQIQYVLLIADETALPAAMGILEQLAQQVNPPHVQAFFEVPVVGDCFDKAKFPFAEIYWLPRDVEQQQHGILLVEAVRQWVNIPALAQTKKQSQVEKNLGGDLLWERAAGAKTFYGWVAAESSVVKTLRRDLIGEKGLDRSTVSFMAYWCL